MPWPKGKKRGWWATPPPFALARGNLAEVELVSFRFSRVGGSETRRLKEQALIDYVESGEYLLAEAHHPGAKLQAELAYRKLLASKRRLETGCRLANARRNSEKNAVVQWIRAHCADVLKDRRKSVKAKCRVIERRMIVSGRQPPSYVSMYRYIREINKGK